jgi:hypothetical protein
MCGEDSGSMRHHSVSSRCINALKARRDQLQKVVDSNEIKKENMWLVIQVQNEIIAQVKLVMVKAAELDPKLAESEEFKELIVKIQEAEEDKWLKFPS